MTVGTVPNLWVQPQTGQLCVMPSSNKLEQPVCSWYVLRAGLDEEGLREVPPVPLEVYYKDVELSRRIDAETNLFSLLARTGRLATLPQDSIPGSSRHWEPGSVVLVSESEMSHIATVKLPTEGLSANLLSAAWLSQANFLLHQYEVTPEQFSCVKLILQTNVIEQEINHEAIEWTKEVYAIIGCYLTSRGYNPNCNNYGKACGYSLT
ncbi:hypothetical protein PM082_018315 [Marasmius tenuissimus]|nr:hypothetical protein PM082_018315 [Marasmius tenuissimus]